MQTSIDEIAAVEDATVKSEPPSSPKIEAALPPKEPSVSSSGTVELSLLSNVSSSGTVELSLLSNARVGPSSVTGHKKCEYGNGCSVQPSFNYPGEMGGMFCGCHRLEGMVNVVNKMCEFEGCHKRPSLNYPGVRPAIRCGEHKLPGMTNSFRKLDTSVLSGDLKEKAEELKKRPKRRGDMIKVQRNLIKEKIFSAVINEELSREGQSQSQSPPNNVQAGVQNAPVSTANSKPNPVIPPRFSMSAPNLSNFSNLSKMPYGSQYQPSNAVFPASAHPGPFLSPDFAAAYVANMNLLNGDSASIRDLGFRATDYFPSLFPGMHQLQFNQFNQFNPGFQPQMLNGKPSLYSNPIPPLLGYMPPPNVSKEGADEVDLSIFASIASSMSHHDKASSSSKRQKFEDGARGKIAELLSRTSEEKSGGAFATVAGRSFRPILGRATPMTFPKC